MAPGRVRRGAGHLFRSQADLAPAPARVGPRQIWRLLLPGRKLDRYSRQWRESLEKQFPRAGERERGATVISTCFDIYAESARKIALLRNPIPDLKKDWCKTLALTLKPNRSEFHNAARDLNPHPDRSSQEKNSPNTDDARFLPGWRNTTENGRKTRPLVTTSHLFWPNKRRKSAFLLPIRLPNPNFLDGKCNAPDRAGGGGGQPRAAAQSAISISSHGIL